MNISIRNHSAVKIHRWERKPPLRYFRLLHSLGNHLPLECHRKMAWSNLGVRISENCVGYILRSKTIVYSYICPCLLAWICLTIGNPQEISLSLCCLDDWPSRFKVHLSKQVQKKYQFPQETIKLVVVVFEGWCDSCGVFIIQQIKREQILDWIKICLNSACLHATWNHPHLSQMKRNVSFFFPSFSVYEMFFTCIISSFLSHFAFVVFSVCVISLWCRWFHSLLPGMCHERFYADDFDISDDISLKRKEHKANHLLNTKSFFGGPWKGFWRKQQSKILGIFGALRWLQNNETNPQGYWNAW